MSANTVSLSAIPETPLESVELIVRWACPTCNQISYVACVTSDGKAINSLKCECGAVKRLPCLNSEEISAPAVTGSAEIRTFADALLMRSPSDLKLAAQTLLDGKWPSLLPCPNSVTLPLHPDFLNSMAEIVLESIGEKTGSGITAVKRRRRGFQTL